MTVYRSSHINTPGNDVTVGGQYQYSEDGAVCDVTVIADESTNDWVGFKLSVDRALSKAWHGGRFDVGQELTIGYNPAFSGAYNGMWRLWPLGEYVTRAEIDEVVAQLRAEGKIG